MIEKIKKMEENPWLKMWLTHHIDDENGNIGKVDGWAHLGHKINVARTENFGEF